MLNFNLIINLTFKSGEKSSYHVNYAAMLSSLGHTIDHQLHCGKKRAKLCYFSITIQQGVIRIYFFFIGIP